MGKLTMTRRTFIKVAAATGAAASLLSAAAPMQALAAYEGTTAASESGVKHIRTSCRGCGKMECGTWATVQNGRVVRIEGDETAFGSYGNCCAKSQASMQAAYHPDRVHYPVKRSTAKDSDDCGWERISWDDAMHIMSQKITECQEKYGRETLMFMGGTSRIWSMSPYGAFKNIFGSPNTIQANEICKGPRFYATTMNDMTEFFWMETVGRPLVYVQWGGASELSNYDDSCRTTVDVAFRAKYHILVDPRCTNMATTSSDIWLPIRPGTDGAMGNAWAQVIIANELYDDFYVRKWSNAPYLVIQEETAPREYILGYGPNAGVFKDGQGNLNTRLLLEADLIEGGSRGKFMMINEAAGDGSFTYYDIERPNPGWENEEWVPATEGFVPNQPGLDWTGQSQGFVMDYVPFPDGIFPALYTGEKDGIEVTLKDGSVVHCKTVWECYEEWLNSKWTPEIVAGICEVPAENIIAAAKTYATRLDPGTGYGNGGIQYMLAQEHACNALNNQRACDLIVAICGNMDVPGSQRGSTKGWPVGNDLGFTMPSSARLRGTDPTKLLGNLDFPMFAANYGPGWADGNSIYKAIETGKPYPVTCGNFQTGDFMNMCNATYNHEMLRSLDFLLCADLWHTPTTETADIVVPACHWLELNCMRKGQGSCGHCGATCQAVLPPGEARSDLQQCIMMAEAIGVPYTDQPGMEWPVDKFLECTQSIGFGGKYPDDPNGEWTWSEYYAYFQEHGWFDMKIWKPEDWGTYRRYQTGKQTNPGRPVRRQGWNTPTQKHEIWCTKTECVMGIEEAFPNWIEPPYSRQAAPGMYKDDTYFLATTGRRQGTYFHSEHRQLPWCRELWPCPRMEINPDDAERLGIQQGDWCWIETNWGKIRQVADLYYGITPGTINLEHQWWYPEFKHAKKGFDLSCVNCLVDKDQQDRFSGTSYLRAYCVHVYKATAENSPFGNPVPCDIDGTEIIHTSDDPRLKEWFSNLETNLEERRAF